MMGLEVTDKCALEEGKENLLVDRQDDNCNAIPEHWSNA